MRGGGEDDERANTWGCEKVDVERGFLRRVMVSGSEGLRLQVRPILLRPPRLSQGNEVVAPAGWHGAKHQESDQGSYIVRVAVRNREWRLRR